MHQRSNSDKTLNYVRNLEVGNHGTFFYESLHEKHEVLFNFLQAGFQKGEGAIYVASHETSKQIRRHMEDFGLNVKSLERDGVLRIVDYYDWYIIDGEVNTSHMMESGLRMFDETAEIGLKGLRGCGEVACFFEHGKEKELVDYELMIGRRFDLPVTALCAYDVNHAKSLEEKLFFNLIKAHGSVVTSSFARQVKFEPFFLTIKEEVLETLLGEMGKETLLRMLYEHHSLTPHKIAEDPGAFIEGLERLIGSGAKVITKLLVKQIHSKMGIGKTAQSSSI
ncbi:MAG: MEDS domain-containing protein [Candidatus Bathyarchaeota archaeon]|nr:MAG: MEDS domain-containing protein [Candidatus Bathyarchaeota archaeon]